MRTISVLNHFFRLVTLKNKPQDLTYSVAIFSVMLCTLFILTSQTARALTANALPAQLQMISPIISWGVILQEIIFLLMLHFMLKRDNKGNRFVQVATNFIGVSLIECLLSPILSKFVLSFYLLCAFKSWLLVIKLHVTRHAFNINQLRAAWIFIGMSICSIFVTAIIMAALSNTMQA